MPLLKRPPKSSIVTSSTVTTVCPLLPVGYVAKGGCKGVEGGGGGDGDRPGAVEDEFDEVVEFVVALPVGLSEGATRVGGIKNKLGGGLTEEEAVGGGLT